MKKIQYILLASLAIGAGASAASLPEEAAAMAEQFLSQKMGGKTADGGSLTAAVMSTSDKTVKKTKSLKKAEFYAYNAPQGGFVLMSANGDDLRVMGYSTDARLSFDNMPEALQEWMVAYKAATASSDFSNSYPTPTVAPVAPLLKTKWGQGAPFNRKCPKYNGNPMLTGCTAPRAPSPAQNITAAIAAADLTGTGFLRLRSFAASNAQPVPDVIVTISQRSGTGIPDKTVTTGPEALSDDVAIACPPRSYSLDENNRTVLPYAVVDVTAEHEGYDPVHVAGVQVFDGEVSLLELLMIPVEEDETAAYTVRSLPEDFDIPTHKLFEGGESSGPTPLSACRPRILDQPIIPEKITVHLGRPSANVQNVTVSFRDYIKNVASSEVYPT